MALVVKVRLRVNLRERDLNVTLNLTGPMDDPAKSVTVAVVKQALHEYIDQLSPELLRVTAKVVEAPVLAHVEDPKP